MHLIIVILPLILVKQKKSSCSVCVSSRRHSIVFLCSRASNSRSLDFIFNQIFVLCFDYIAVFELTPVVIGYKFLSAWYFWSRQPSIYEKSHGHINESIVSKLLTNWNTRMWRNVNFIIVGNSSWISSSNLEERIRTSAHFKQARSTLNIVLDVYNQIDAIFSSICSLDLFHLIFTILLIEIL